MDTNTAAAVGIVGLIMSFFFIAVIWYVLCLISRWKVFDKAGIAGWKSLIPMLSTVCGLTVMVINLIMNISLAARFGHGVLFGLGLTFFGPIFYMILGLGASEYNGNPEEGLPARKVMYV